MISSIKKSLIFLLFGLASVRADSFLDSPEPFFVLVLIFFIGAFCVVCLKASGHACQGVQGDFRDVPYPNSKLPIDCLSVSILFSNNKLII